MLARDNSLPIGKETFDFSSDILLAQSSLGKFLIHCVLNFYSLGYASSSFSLWLIIIIGSFAFRLG